MGDYRISEGGQTMNCDRVHKRGVDFSRFCPIDNYGRVVGQKLEE
jgi:hypothetical protein